MRVRRGFLRSCSNNSWSLLGFLLVRFQYCDRTSHGCIPVHRSFWFRGSDYDLFNGSHVWKCNYLWLLTSEEGVGQNSLKCGKNLRVILTTISTKTVIFH